ncbi:TPA: hypothetical protein MA058_003461 [Klebsiella pneumoniae]|nr:hypothetical protein [Klebsiella pneumoniae]
MAKAKTWEEYKAECEAVAKDGVTILGFVKPWKGKDTKIICNCQKHGEWNTTTVVNFKRGASCPICANSSKGQHKKEDIETTVIKFLDSGKFKTGTKFWRPESFGATQYEKGLWHYTCPTCSHDEYVKEGLCSGVFKGSMWGLKRGKLSCRCSNNFRWTEKQREFQIKQRIEVENLPYIFVKWVSMYRNSSSNFIYECKYHGLKTAALNTFLNNKSGCPGCAGREKLTQSYATKIVEDLCSIKNYRFEPFLYKNNKTKITLSCNNKTHPNWEVTFKNFVNQENGCPACFSARRGANHKILDEVHIKDFMATGVFKEGTTFWRSSRLTSSGDKNYWEYTCPVCSNDEYVKAGLCSGVFTSYVGSLKKGSLSCRCSSNYKYTKSQWEFRLRRLCAVRGYIFLGWAGKSWGSEYKFTYHCQAHGKQAMLPGPFLKGSGCPECQGKTQQQCYINIVYDGEVPVALKFGIANLGIRRVKTQNRRNLLQMKQTHVYEFPSVQQCRGAENTCKDELPCGILSSRELKDGWTETTSILNLDKIIEIYERFGGKRVK